MTSQFNTVLRQLRQRAGLTQDELAARSGIAVRTIRRLERGESTNPQMGTVRLLADHLGLDGDERARLLAAADGKAPPVRPVPLEVPGTPVDPQVARAADDLAQVVAARWRREEERRRIHDPFPLPVRWEPAADGLMDHWDNICRTSPGQAAEPAELCGRLDEIVAVYQRVPSGRLVVLGQAGSGKTILAVRFVLDLLKSRQPAGAVPVVVGLASWNPTTTLFRDWLISQLVRDFPGLSAPGPGATSLAAALVDADRVLPVLDGFDEIAEGLHRDAFDALNATTLPLLLTSRPSEYAAVAEADVLTAAAVVTLSDLAVTDLVNYLPRTARKTAANATVWDPVLAKLRAEPDSAASVNLIEVLSTPLMVGLARAIHSDSGGSDPMVLLDSDQFASAAAIEQHLLASFVPTVYQHQQEHDWAPERVNHWLGYLARHMNRLGTRDLAWWQLGASIRRPLRTLAVGLVVAILIGVVDWFSEGVVMRGAGAVLGALVIGSVSGLAVGIAHDLFARSGGAIEPMRVRIRIRGGPVRVRAKFLRRFRVGLLGGMVLGFSYGLLRGIALRTVEWFMFIDALLFALVFGVGAGAVFALVALFETPLDISSAVSPADLLSSNRRTVGFQLLVFGPVFALFISVGTWLLIRVLQGSGIGARFGLTFVWDPVWGLLAGFLGAVGGGLAYVLGLTAWGQWVVFSRIWLPLTGRLPWEVATFLDDACRRGVLRQAGAVYQFRHARLQDYLAATTDRT
nr:helix-turn-helix domain-containing protein [Kibdelosporangium sp. MJ126-NF4]CEL20031.1 transcriptional regulator, XRE family [Kibdelosporangium sp. MJ126-NF4]CTQ97255.1 transcriptional regulator, XRE family [Kibdelosporangium sp. MJ126-NF4]